MVDKVILCLCLISMLSNASFSLIAPFYPLVVKEKGIDVIYIGFLMGTQALTFIFSSVVTGLLLHRIGRSRGMILGVLLIIVSILGLGSLIYVEDKETFIYLSFLWKFLCGFGSGINSTSTMAIVTTLYKDEREKAIGLIEATSGVGLLLGPFFGALLYEIGGYMLPFVATASVYFFIYPLIAFSLAAISENEKATEISQQSQREISTLEKEFPDITMSDLAKIPRFLFGLISQMLVYATITSLQPILALHLEEFGYTAVFIGFSFAVPTLVYASTSPLIYILTARFKKSTVIMLGYTLMSTGMFLVGTSKLLGIYNSPAFIIIGLSIMGFGGGMIIIPILPDMIDSVEERYPKMDFSDLHNRMSGLFIACQGIGETVGPVFGSMSEDIYGFRITQDILACTLIVFLALYFLCCGRLSLIALNPSYSQSQLTTESGMKKEVQSERIEDKGKTKLEEFEMQAIIGSAGNASRSTASRVGKSDHQKISHSDFIQQSNALGVKSEQLYQSQDKYNEFKDEES